MLDFIAYLRFLWLATKAYRAADGGGSGNGSSYFGLAHRSGPCVLAIFVGRGREAWRVTSRAIEDYPA